MAVNQLVRTKTKYPRSECYWQSLRTFILSRKRKKGIEEDNAKCKISRVVAGLFVSLTFRTLGISYPTGVSYPSQSDLERTHIGNTI